MVPQIDFLPATYHQQQRRKHTTLWRRMMVFFFLALAMLGTWQQRQLQRKLQARRDELKSQAEGLEQLLPLDTDLERRLRDLDVQTQLLTQLSVRVPTTRVLAALTNALPQFVSLNECQAEFGAVEGLAAPNMRVPPPSTASGENKSPASPFETDVAELNLAKDRSALLITLHGLAPDDFAISRYLVRLRETKLFERSTLVYSGQHRVRDEVLRSFQLRLQVKNPKDWLETTPASGQRVVLDAIRSLPRSGQTHTQGL
jgi:hypothetical protein